MPPPFLEQALVKGDFCYAALAVERNNYSSLKSVYRMGYKNFGRLAVMKVFGKYIVRPDRNCRAYDFNLKAV